MIYRISKDQLIDDRQRLESLKYDKYVKLEPYINDVKGYFPYVEDLRNSIFLLKKEATKTANAIFQSIKNTYRATKKLPLTTNITMVLIHVRLTDFPGHLKKKLNMALSDYMANSFLTDAMRYFTNRYEVS